MTHICLVNDFRVGGTNEEARDFGGLALLKFPHPSDNISTLKSTVVIE